RDGFDRAAARRSGSQPRRATAARAGGHRAATGARDAAGRPRAVVRDDALGAVGAADDQSELADDDDRRRRLPDQHALRLCGGQRAVPDFARRGRRRRVVLPAARRRKGAAMNGLVGRRWTEVVGLAVLLGLFAFAIFGPLANLFLWAFAEKWYF